MAKKKSSIEDKLAELSSLEKSPISEQSIQALKKALSAKNNLLAARAARVIGNLNLQDLISELTTCFYRCTTQPLKTDKGCVAKIAAVKALNTLGDQNADIYLTGIHTIQMEPAFGPPVDTAEMLRIESLSGLMRIGHPDTLIEITTLLMDPETSVRKAAVQALAGIGTDTCECLLRLKTLNPDDDLDVTGECMAGLMAVNPNRSIAFIAKFLTDETSLSEYAALALGQSGLDNALDYLLNHWKTCLNQTIRAMLCLPIAISRQDIAFNFLLNVISDGPKNLVDSAKSALRIFEDNPQRKAAIDQAVKKRQDSDGY